MKLNLRLQLPVLLALVLAARTTPVNDAIVATYHAPSGATAYKYDGPLNHWQTEHLQSGVFPRLTESEWKMLHQVNRRVNSDLTYLSDMDNYGCGELWVTEPPIHRPVKFGLPPARYADCEDYALTKKQRLVRIGFSASRLLVATAEVTEFGDVFHHSVVVIPEGSEWWVLDTKDNLISRASNLEHWWGWKFEKPAFDTYHATATTQHSLHQTATSRNYATGSGQIRAHR